MNNQPSPPRRRFRLRFSLRTLLILIALCAVAVAWVVRWDQRAKIQREIVAQRGSEKIKIHGWIEVDSGVVYEGDYSPLWGNTPIPKWLQGTLDHHHVYNVVGITQFVDSKNAIERMERLPALRSLAIFVDRNSAISAYEPLRDLPNITAFGLHESSYPREPSRVTLDEVMSIAGTMHQLTSLEIGGPSITDLGLAEVQRLPNLRRLSINFTVQISDNALSQLGKLPQLHELDLNLLPFDAEELRTLDYGSPTQFAKARYQPITAASLAFLKNLKSLQSLRLVGNAGIDPDAITHLSDLPKLRSLRIISAKILDNEQYSSIFYDGAAATDETLRELAKLRHLRSLALDVPSTATDAGMAELAKLTELEELKLTISEKVTQETPHAGAAPQFTY